MKQRLRSKIAWLVCIVQQYLSAHSFALPVSQNICAELAISLLIVYVSSLPSSVALAASSQLPLPPPSLQNSSEVQSSEGRSLISNVNLSLSLNDLGKTHRTRTSRRFRLTKSNPSFTLNKEPKRKTRRRKSKPHFTEKVDTKPLKHFNEEVADLLRKNILSQLGDLDPLLCLPKALCGLSSRQTHIEKEPSTNAIGLGLDPTNTDALSNYFQIMKTVVQQGSSPKKPKRKSKSTKTGFGGYYYDDEANSASLPSEEDSSEEMDDYNSRDTDDDEDSHSQQVTFFADLDEDDLEYYREKKRMQKLMEEEETNQDLNWWDTLPSTEPYRNVYPDEKDQDSKWPQFTFMPSSFSSFIGSMMPSMLWGFGSKSPDAFSSDPFFQNSRSLGRSLDRGVSDPKSFLESLLGKKFASTLENLPKDPNQKKIQTTSVRKAKMITRRKKKTTPQAHRINSKRKRLPSKAAPVKSKTMTDKVHEINIDDPVERFQMAIEIGKKLKTPQQCEYVFNGCPFSYEEIVAIIDLTRKNTEQTLNEDISSEPAKGETSNESKTVVKTPAGATYEIEFKFGNSSTQNPSKPQSISKPTRHHPPSRKKPKPKRPSSPSILPTRYTMYEPVTIYRTGLPSEADSSQPTLDPVTPQTPAPHPISLLTTPKPPQNNKLRPLKKTKGKKSIRHKQWGKGPTKSPKYQFQKPHSKQVNQNNHPYAFEPVMYHSSSPTVTNYHYYNSNGPSVATANYHPYPFDIVKKDPQPHLKNGNLNSTDSLETSTFPSTPSESISQSTEPPISSTSNPLSKGTRKGKKSPKKKTKTSEERIVIRLTDAPPTNPLNNFFNIVPIPFRNIFSSASEQYSSSLSNLQHPQAIQPSQQHLAQYYKPLAAVSNYLPSLPFQSYSTPPTYYPLNYHHHHHPHASHLPSPSPSSPMFPSMLSYVFGKKKKK